jgi:hypothetical protein
MEDECADAIDESLRRVCTAVRSRLSKVQAMRNMVRQISKAEPVLAYPPPAHEQITSAALPMEGAAPGELLLQGENAALEKFLRARDSTQPKVQAPVGFWSWARGVFGRR